MQDSYSHTSLTPLKVARSGGYLDWNSQPSMFKHYPKFLYRYKYGSQTALKVIELSRYITSISYIASMPYYRLNTPSAGNLHPVELYVQIRGIKEIISGIYHVDAGAGEIVLIKEIDKEGIEPYVGFSQKVKGIMFLIASVPFRSSWKYRDRSTRYCYLDAGHQIGAIDAACKSLGQTATILSLQESSVLSKMMGFREDEHLIGALYAGESLDKSVERFQEQFIYTSPCDYIQTNRYVTDLLSRQSGIKSFEFPKYSVNESVIESRRSSRQFTPFPLKETQLEHLLEFIGKPIEGLECYGIVLKSQNMKKGIYKNRELMLEGDFSDTACGILLGQSFIRNAALINVICAKTFDVQMLVRAGAFAHALALDAESNGVGFSGIGAFYDEELQKLLSTQEYILYVNVLGVDAT